MITDFLLKALLWIIQLTLYPLRALPDVSFSSQFTASITAVANYLALLNNIIPMTTIFIVFALTLVFEGGVLTYKLIMWVIKKIPTIN